jgi:hypothetical protein
MSTVNNATGVFATLGYNFSDPNGYVDPLSSDAIDYLEKQPAFIKTWQAQDIANNAVSGYFQNPVLTYVNTILTTANTIAANLAVANCSALVSAQTACITLSATAVAFNAHTNRLSAITPFNGEDVTNPYYETAISFGKTALYITNQTDNITNTSPILGSFGSILIGPQISNQSNTIYPYIALIANSITGNSQSSVGGNTSLTATQINQIVSDISNTNTLLSSQRSADVAFYGNLKTFSDKYNTVRQFSSMGETQTYLCNNFIGTDKLITRINSQEA